MPSQARTTRARWLAHVALLAVGALVAPRAAAAVSPELLEAIEARFRHGLSTLSREPDTTTLAEVQAVYAGFEFRPLWVGDAGVDSRGRELAGAIRALWLDGLDPEDYWASRIEALLPALDRSSLAELELRLSFALVTAASDLAAGRIHPRTVNPELFIYPLDVDKAQVLEQARTSEDIASHLQSFQPSQANYQRLKDVLAEYRARSVHERWTAIPGGETLRIGMTDPRVPALRARLAALRDLPATGPGGGPGPAPPSTDFDRGLEDAVKRFQRRHGLDVDGLVGRATLAALNVPLDARVKQILLNMERRRWMPDAFEERYVFVNLADFQLKVVHRVGDRERTIFATEVVVGKPYHQTPEFSDRIRYLELNPYWNVPIRIARNDLLPKIKADPEFLIENGYELFDGWTRTANLVDPQTIDWDSMVRANFRYKLRQAPGPRNALGRIKFMFPNEHDIYLHDTPARTLFQRTQRAFSNGCIRVKDPERLAEVLLGWQSDWPPARVHRAIESGRRTVVSLATPIPIHLAYITAWVNKDGTVHFRDDVYGRDATLARALYPPVATAQAS